MGNLDVFASQLSQQLHVVIARHTESGTGRYHSYYQAKQQLRQAFPESCPYRYAILDRDGKFGDEVTELLAATGMNPTRISPASPWQNGIAERWIGSCRRELLDHLIVLNETHLRRLMQQYISYYHADRIHDSLEKDTPAVRPIASKPAPSARLVSFPRMGGLHHRYDWQQAA